MSIIGELLLLFLLSVSAISLLYPFSTECKRNEFSKMAGVKRSSCLNNDVEWNTYVRLLHTSNNCEITKEIEDDLKYVYGDSYQNKFELRSFHSKNYFKKPRVNRETFWAENLLLSHKGIIMQEVFDCGIIIPQWTSDEDLGYYRRMMQRIEHNLALNGVYVKFFRKNEVWGDYALDCNIFDRRNYIREW